VCSGRVHKPRLAEPRADELGETLSVFQLRQVADAGQHLASRPWADGTTHLVFTPPELLERLVPLVPRPRINLLLYHGVLAPNAPWRRAVVAHPVGESEAIQDAASLTTSDTVVVDVTKRLRMRPRHRTWAELMRRAFEADVLDCPRCGGRMVVLATIDDPAVIHRILTHLGLSTEPGEPAPGRAPPWGDGGRLGIIVCGRPMCPGRGCQRPGLRASVSP
jgi:hypothetical protein